MSSGAATPAGCAGSRCWRAAVLPALILAALPAGILATALAATLHLAGALAQRWLFFAEAEHVVGLYYGAR